MKKRLPEYAALCNANPIFKGRLVGIGHLDLAGCLALGTTGPPLRATGYPWDLRRTQPYFGYDTYDFDVVTWDTCDAYGRFRIRLEEMWQSLRIIEQCSQRLAASEATRSSWRTRRSPGPRSWPSEATGWGTPSTTSGTSWASRWRR
jgi:NADH-quinone oxidoreductase subunit D